MLSCEFHRLHNEKAAKWKEITSFHILLSILTHLTRKLDTKFSFPNQIIDPLDEQIKRCFFKIRKHTCIQNNGIIFAFKHQNWNPMVVLIDILNQRCFQLNMRIHDNWFLGTIIEGQLFMDQSIYRPIIWSVPDPQKCGLPTSPPLSQFEEEEEEEEDEEEDEGEEEEEEEDDDNPHLVEEDSSLEEEEIEPQTKILKSELQHLQKTTIPDQRQRSSCCRFYARELKYAFGKEIQDIQAAADYVQHYSTLNELLSPKYFIQDHLISNIEMHNELDGVYAFQYQKDKVDKQLGLSKTIPFSHLHMKIVDHLKSIPKLCSKFDFNKIAHFQVSYYGSSKPGIYILHVLKGKEKKMVKHGIAYIPTLEIQQYVVHLLKTRGTSKPLVMKCAFAPEKKKWTPIKFILKRNEPDQYTFVNSISSSMVN